MDNKDLRAMFNLPPCCSGKDGCTSNNQVERNYHDEYRKQQKIVSMLGKMDIMTQYGIVDAKEDNKTEKDFKFEDDMLASLHKRRVNLSASEVDAVKLAGFRFAMSSFIIEGEFDKFLPLLVRYDTDPFRNRGAWFIYSLGGMRDITPQDKYNGYIPEYCPNSTLPVVLFMSTFQKEKPLVQQYFHVKSARIYFDIHSRFGMGCVGVTNFSSAYESKRIVHVEAKDVFTPDMSAHNFGQYLNDYILTLKSRDDVGYYSMKESDSEEWVGNELLSRTTTFINSRGEEYYPNRFKH
jgi:hypothetical protein